jgi:moderate conductance mechanosensitive channel
MEVAFAICLFVIVDWLGEKFYKQCMAVAWLQKGEKIAKLMKNTFQKVLFLTTIILIITIIIINSWLIYQGNELQEITYYLLKQIPQEVWLTLVTGTSQSILVIILAAIILRNMRSSTKKICINTKNFKQIETNNKSIDEFFQVVDNSLTTGIWLFGINLCSQFFRLPKIFIDYLYILLNIYLICAIGFLLITAIAAVIDTLSALSEDHINDHNFLKYYPRFRHLIPFIKNCIKYIIYVCMGSLIFVQFEKLVFLGDYATVVVKIITVILLSKIFIEISHLLIEKFLLKSDNLTVIQKRKRLTFIPLMQNTARYLIYFGVMVTILYIIKIDPTPILAGAGIVGIAVGLGTQSLLNDLVNGFSILLQNYYLVGDFIKTDGAEGIVEAIDLRVTRIRHLDGSQHIIRNGDISRIINYSKEYVNAMVSVGVDYDSNLDHVYKVIDTVGKKLKEINEDVLEATIVNGLDNFGESDLVIRTTTKVKPGKHIVVQRLLRKMIKEAFDQEGIEIPFARQVVIFKNQNEAQTQINNQE